MMGRSSLSHHASAITLEQLQVFDAVVASGSFSAAARALRKTQSAISYHINALEEQLEVTLFHRSGRRTVVTPEGEALLTRARRVVAALSELRGASRAIAAGLEPRLTVAYNVLTPVDTIAEPLAEFAARFPTTDVTLLTAAQREATPSAIRDGQADLGIVSYLDRSEDLLVEPCGSVAMIPVVAPTHPLGCTSRPVSDAELQEHVHVMLGEEPGPEMEAVLGFPSTRRWRANRMPLRLELLRAGLGWGRMPEHLVAEDLRRGSLVRVMARRWGDREIRVELFLARHKHRPLGPAGQWLWGRLAQGVVQNRQ
jgi:DNA-binding transcriptional LysR family regulator